MSTWVSWSSGKDSAYALHDATARLGLDVRGLLCTMTADFDRVSMHGVRRELVVAQSGRLGLPVRFVDLPAGCPFDVYEQQMAAALGQARDEGVRSIVFGDLYLEDVRTYRERSLAPFGIEPLFPLWGRPTAGLAREMLAAGVRAVVTCVDPGALSPSMAGAAFDDAFLGRLPAPVDPCGENGEFHTFVWDSPNFSEPVRVEVGAPLASGGFVFCEVRETSDPVGSRTT